MVDGDVEHDHLDHALLNHTLKKFTISFAGGENPGANGLKETAFTPMQAASQVRRTPSWPRSWANFSLLWMYSNIPTGMHRPTCIFWANLTPLSLHCQIEAVYSIVFKAIDAGFHIESKTHLISRKALGNLERSMEDGKELLRRDQVRKTPGWPRMWANFSLL